MATAAKTARKRMAKAKARPAHARAKARGGPRGVGASGETAGQRDITRLLEQIVHQNQALAEHLQELTLAIRNRAEVEVLSNG